MNVHASNNKSTVETPQRSDSLDNLRLWLSDGARRQLTDEELEALEFLYQKPKLIRSLRQNTRMILKLAKIMLQECQTYKMGLLQ